MPNLPEYAFQMFGAALAGACIVGINATRRGAELARDIEHTSCQFVVADATYAELVDGPVRVEEQPWAGHAGAALPEVDPPPSTLMCLLLTSGSTSAPKAAMRSQGRLAGGAGIGFGAKDTLYCPMPLSHGNALSAALFPALARGSRLLLRDRFSATSWLDDVRTHGVTFTNTVGRALGYVLATPPSPHDRDHRLKVGAGARGIAAGHGGVPRSVRRHRVERVRLERGRHRAGPVAQARIARHRTARCRHRRRRRLGHGM